MANFIPRPYSILIIVTKVIHIKFEDLSRSRLLCLENLTLTKSKLEIKKYLLPCLTVEPPALHRDSF